jgi:8-oxo-dGTP pyrophosphatase MutT (NUDIX family)
MNGIWNRFLTEKELNAAAIVVCIKDNNHFLILRRSDIDDRCGQWTLPGGHVDEKDESIEHAAVRELNEEANLCCKVEDLTFLGEPKAEKYYFWTTKWSGTVDVKKPNPETGEIEHDDHRWAAIEDIKEIANTEIPIYLLEKLLEMSKNETNS